MYSKPEIITHGGTYFNFLNPDESEFTIVDIAQALSKICRFTGHVHQFYSVAQHSVLVSKIVPPEHALAGLLHDAAEAFIGDVSSPLKALLPDYKAIELRVERAVLARFGLEPFLHHSVKHADMVLLKTEHRDLMNPLSGLLDVVKDFEALPARIEPLMPPEACVLFLERFEQLTEDMAMRPIRPKLVF